MIKKFRVGFFVILFVSLLFGCQIQTTEQASVLSNDVIEARDDVELEESEEVQSEEVPSEEVPSEEVQSEEVLSEEVPSEEVQSEEVQSEEVPSEEVQPEEVQPEEVQSEEVQPEEVQPELTENISSGEEIDSTITIDEEGSYTSKDEVALYIHTYNKLPSNYITKKEAQERGWNNKENTVAKVLPGMSIGGDRFGNYEGILPKGEGLSYKECDIDYVSGSRNAKRIVFSNDGSIYYTGDHYSTFEQLY